eukprot:COSAG06_NODE_12323_length_1395_cov_1.470679_1_plen_41_part_10
MIEKTGVAIVPQEKTHPEVVAAMVALESKDPKILGGWGHQE